ncbi:MAG TPA: AgmX/PglI C-terminal domain-containing protein, partial [Enhygromyxa sp.]|nr:AgmX/PglI C-terminal domain-containing protein [Enhygromyxa sp.]
VIGPRGKVARVKVKSTELKPADAAVEACFSKVVQRGLFPKPRDGSSVEVEFPFVLVPPARGEQ